MPVHRGRGPNDPECHSRRRSRPRGHRHGDGQTNKITVVVNDFSSVDADPDADLMFLLYRVVVSGDRLLDSLSRGDSIDR